MESNDFKTFVDEINAAAAREVNNPRAIKIAHFFQDIYAGYDRFYTEADLKKGLKQINSDKTFIEPIGIPDGNPPQTIEEGVIRLKLLFWEDNILKRFKMFA